MEFFYLKEDEKEKKRTIGQAIQRKNMKTAVDIFPQLEFINIP